ncbi:riboflavin synthase subunit alpha [Nonlabens dokdonensis DSW-6]|uniref:Riboflavin synthase subunit alpha n=2 Tax=Nonlabens dokdonensis TaxID=328515 RepID=L7W971_NONDD|nr:riboflavin synthase subunit alpha [Nonlabens dokdonensis DSW-6]
MISFAGLKQGKHQFKYEVDNTFFENFGFEEFNSSSITVEAQLDKRNTIMDLLLEAQGSVNVNCDVTNEPFDLEINASMDLVIKFGEAFNDDNEELLILSHGDYEFNIAQYVYEMIVLSIPQKRVHPGVEDGSLESDVLEKLEELSVSDPEENKNKEIDPRWEALKKLKTDNNL